MMHKKGKFLNFCFSCIPGAGQMYQGFMKRGVSIMTVFFGMLALISYFGIDELIFCLPIIWFFGFFDGIHLNSLPDNEYSQLEDGYLFTGGEMPQFHLKKLRVPAAIGLILLGSYSLFRVVVNYMIWEDVLFWDSPAARFVYDLFPKVLFSALIIGLGVYLIVGKKKEIEQENYGEDAFYRENRSYLEEDFSDRAENAGLAEDEPEDIKAWDAAEEFPESVLMQEDGQSEEEKEEGEV